MTRDMRRRCTRWAAMGVALLIGVAPVIAPTAGGQVPLADAQVAASATGTVVHAGLVQSGDVRLVDAEVASSGAVYDSSGLGTTAYNEMQRAFGATRPDKLAYGRGSALEVGLGVTPETDNQLILAGKAEADAPPTGDLVTEEIGPLDLAPLAWANLLRGRAAADASPEVCTLGADLSHASAYVAALELLDTGVSAPSSSVAAQQPGQQTTNDDAPASDEPTDAVRGLLRTVTKPVTDLLDAPLEAGEAAAGPGPALQASVSGEPEEGFRSPLLTLNADDPKRAVSQSRSRTLLVSQRGAQGQTLGQDLGVMSEVRQTIAPVTLFKATPNELTIELLGEWVLQVVATGVPGGAYVHYGPGQVSPDTPVLRLLDTTGVTRILSLQDLFGDDGLVIEIPGLLEIAIGEAPRAIGGAAGSSPSVAADGTSVSAAVDAVRVRALPGAPVELADLRIGHMEASALVPSGGVECPFPITKVPDADTVEVDGVFSVTYTVTNPYDCTLTGVRITDEVSTEGAALFTVLGTDPAATTSPAGSDLDSATIAWTGLPDISPGSSLTMTADFRAAGGTGTIVDRATASATLIDCAGDGATVGGVDVSAVGAGIAGVTPQVRVEVVEEEVAVSVLPHAEVLPRTGVSIASMVAAALMLLAAGGSGMLLARRRR